MRLLSRLWILGITVMVSHLALAAYQSAEVIGGFRTGGYVDTRIDGNTAIIYYDGTRYDSPESVRKYLLFRSAQVTLDNGYDYFIITSSNTSRYNVKVHTRKTQHYVSSPPRLFDQDYTRTDYRYSTYVRSRVPNPNIPCAPPQHGASAVIKMFNGDVPENIPTAYDAEDVIGHLAPDTF